MKRGAIAAVLLGLVMVGCGGPSSLEVADGWSRPVPPVAQTSAVFMEITNGLDTDVTLLTASSAACGAIELHRTDMVDGVMTMRPLDGGLVIAAGGTAVLEPGATHLMCVDPDHDGTSFNVTLQFSGSPDIDLDVLIQERYRSVA